MSRRSTRVYGMLSTMTRRTPANPSGTRLIRITALAAAGIVGLTGCVSGGTGTSSSPSSSSAPSSRQGSASPSQTILQSQWADIGTSTRVDLMSLDRISPTVVALRLRIANNGTDSVDVSDAFRPTSGPAQSFGGTVLLDGKDLRAYYPWQKSADSSILESGFPDLGHVDGNEYFSASILYPAPPAGVTSVDIFAPRVVFHNVPINPNGKPQTNDPGFDKSELDQPKILSIRSMRDDLSGDKVVDDSGDKISVRLSSDVLFKLNKSNLTDKANALLKQVATQIDQSKGTTISVDGYTDNSGNDAINDPLSNRRAASVRNALQKLVTRQGVTYKVAGHGSSDPVASNKSAEGRQKNRRVSISFSK